MVLIGHLPRRSGVSPGRDPEPAIAEAGRGGRFRVDQISRIGERTLFHHVSGTVEVDLAEFGPLGQHDHDGARWRHADVYGSAQISMSSIGWLIAGS